MATIWSAPQSGDLLNDGEPWRRADVVNVNLELDTSHPLFSDFEAITMIGGTLPLGLFFNGGSNKIMGTIEELPKDKTEYPVVFRVTFQNSTRTYDRSFKLIVNPIDEEQHWESPTGIQYLGTFNRGSGVTVQLDIVNPDRDKLVYKAVGFVGPANTFQGLPGGLEIDSRGRIVGSPNITGNKPGDYYFRVYARDPDDLLSNPREEGSPRTSEKIYRLTIGTEIVLDARLSDAVRWETPAGSLGSTYETYPSHFAVKAVPQYEVSGLNSLESQTIQYTITPKSKPLPDGLLLDPMSGLIIGRCPYVTINKTFEFTVEARVVFVHNETGAIRQSTIAGERTFSITIRNIFISESTTSLQINVSPLIREKLARWVWGNQAELRTQDKLTILGWDNLFRRSDVYFGRKRDYKILLTNGLNYSGGLLDYLKDYHHPTTLRVGQIKSAKARSPEGTHIYDVIYMTIVDPMEGAGGFNSIQREEHLPRYVAGQNPTAINQWNLPADQNQYYPNSIKNLRLDLINTANRLAGQAGLGILGREGLPLWMMCEQELGKPSTVLGYQAAIELAYVRSGSGPAIVKALETAGMNEDLQGSTIEVDRYLLLSDGFSATTFYNDMDGDAKDDDSEELSFLDIIIFDGPENPDTPTTTPTTFDRALKSESKYYKFPPGDI
jgi:hypothetical protein